MEKELWIAHCLQATTGRVLIAIVDSRKNANQLHKSMCIDLNWDDEDFSKEDFVCTTQKITKLNEVVLELT